MSTQNNRRRRFFIPTTTLQFQTCLQRLSLKILNCFFYMADRALFILGPILIALASVIIIGLTYLYFCILLPMMAGTNWIATVDDYYVYWNQRGYHHHHYDNDVLPASAPPSNISLTRCILLALTTPTGLFHTFIVAFFLVNVTYNYYQCVTTSNSGKVYDVVVRELAQVTNFNYPETDEELLQCKRNLERKIADKLECRRREFMAAAASSAATASQNNIATNDGGGADVETATATAKTATTFPQPIPRIHNWQLLSPTEWSYCRFSSQPKPPRSHYDHVTKSLVLNMDHYCPWMFNCVGYFNYRFFVNFLFFTTTGLLYGTMICARPFMNLSGNEYRDQIRVNGVASLQNGKKVLVVKHLETNPYIPTPNERTAVALGFMICLCLCCAVGCLLGFHLYLTLSAQTTIEFHGNWAKRRSSSKKKGGWKNPYSTGNWKRNWEMIYGTRYHHFQLRGKVVESNSDDEIGANATMENQYSYHGCWGILMAMMPSRREPEFLPLPFDGVLFRRKKRVNASSLEFDNKKVDEEMAAVAAEEEEPTKGLLSSWDNHDGDDLLNVFRKKKSSSRNTTELIERTGKNAPKREDIIV